MPKKKKRRKKSFVGSTPGVLQILLFKITNKTNLILL